MTLRARELAGDVQVGSSPTALRKRIVFVMDLSGSMYTFNRLDGRLERLLEIAVLIFEAFDGSEDKYEYAMVGHSGSTARESLVEWRQPPTTRKARLQLIARMAAHAQYCWSGDHTLDATQRAIKEVHR
jgi:hypothetical protein